MAVVFFQKKQHPQALFLSFYFIPRIDLVDDSV